MISNANSDLPPVRIIREKVLMERLISGTFSAWNQPKSGITRPPQPPPGRACGATA